MTMQLLAMVRVIKWVKTVMTLITVLLVMSCWHREMEETVNLIINNGLDNHIELKFFKNGLPSGKKSTSRLGKGEVFSDGDTNTGVQINGIFEADSIEMIFDNERIETHKLFYNEPVGNSLFDFSSYEKKGDTHTYTIDEKNYNNAILCDGPCN
jgi:hypothetical protein